MPLPASQMEVSLTHQGSVVRETVFRASPDPMMHNAVSAGICSTVQISQESWQISIYYSLMNAQGRPAQGSPEHRTYSTPNRRYLLRCLARPRTCSSPNAAGTVHSSVEWVSSDGARGDSGSATRFRFAGGSAKAFRRGNATSCSAAGLTGCNFTKHNVLACLPHITASSAVCAGVLSRKVMHAAHRQDRRRQRLGNCHREAHSIRAPRHNIEARAGRQHPALPSIKQVHELPGVSQVCSGRCTAAQLLHRKGCTDIRLSKASLRRGAACAHAMHGSVQLSRPCMLILWQFRRTEWRTIGPQRLQQ